MAYPESLRDRLPRSETYPLRRTHLDSALAAAGVLPPCRDRRMAHFRVGGGSRGGVHRREAVAASAVTLPDALGPIALDLPGGAHEWAVGVRLLDHEGQLRLVWHGGHEHVCQLTGPPVVDGDRLLVTTSEHGQLVLRDFESSDRWLVHGDAGSMTAWEARCRGLT